MSTVTQELTDPSAVTTPATGQASSFVDLSGIRRLKNDAGATTPDSPNVATSIEPSSPSTPIPVTGDAGNLGYVLTKTVDTGNGEVGLVDPRGDLNVSRNTNQVRAVVTALAITNDLVLGELLVVDPEAIGGPHEVILPPAVVAGVGQAVSIKIFGPLAGQTVTLTPDGTDVIDKAEANRVFSFDKEQITLRIRFDGGGWLEVSE